MIPEINLEALSAAGLRESATTSTIASVERELGVNFPADYKAFLLRTDGYEGVIGENYAQLYRAIEIPESQRGYEIDSYVPGFVIFGSNGGGEAYGFDSRTSPWNVYMLPFIGMEWKEAVKIGTSFEDFLKQGSVADFGKMIITGERAN
jgi:hypothetical protein